MTRNTMKKTVKKTEKLTKKLKDDYKIVEQEYKKKNCSSSHQPFRSRKLY